MSNKDYDDIYSSTKRTNHSAGNSSSIDIYSSTAKSRVSKKEYQRFKKLRITANVILSVILVISILFATVLGAMQYVMGDMYYSEITDNASELGIDQTVKLDKNVYNIALFGVDTRGNTFSGLSDSIIIVSVNVKENTVKMTSILRDSYVPIDGLGQSKINAAYSKGGPVLAIKTLNQNFKLNITEYATINMVMLEKVIDLLGGVDLHITERERTHLNSLIDSEKRKIDKVQKSSVAADGLVHLNGGQAMMYSRLRKIDSDNLRARRQQKVLGCMFAKIKEKKVSEYPELLKKILGFVETSLTSTEILNLVSNLDVPNMKLTSTSVPGDEVVAIGGTYGKAGWVWRYDTNEAADYIHEWIYGSINVTEEETTKQK